MNPLTKIKNTQKITAREIAAGVSDDGSWHAKYKNSAYIYVGGIPFDLTEGDLLAVFSQYGEIVDVNLVRDKATGKSRGFAFLAYEDQRSTVLSVDNLNGAKVGGRIVRVDHVENYKRKLQEEEGEEEERRKKREENGVCYAFQRGECNRGSSCKFSHDEQRNANTGWGSRYDDLDAERTQKNKRHTKETGDAQQRIPDHPIPSSSQPFLETVPEANGRRAQKSEENPWEGSLFSLLSGPLSNEKKRKKDDISSEKNDTDRGKKRKNVDKDGKEKERREGNEIKKGKDKNRLEQENDGKEKTNNDVGKRKGSEKHGDREQRKMKDRGDGEPGENRRTRNERDESDGMGVKEREERKEKDQSRVKDERSDRNERRDRVERRDRDERRRDETGDRHERRDRDERRRDETGGRDERRVRDDRRKQES